jgi:hypothetical protein
LTIAAAYLTSEGVVFGADSAITVSPKGAAQAGALQIFNHSQKIFEIGPENHGRMALATWGAGSVNHVSHRTIAARLGDKVRDENSISDATEILKEIVTEIRPDGAFGYFLGGTNVPSRDPECCMLEFKPDKPVEIVKLTTGQAVFQGAPDLFIRAFHGCDPKLLEIVVAILKKEIGDRVSDFDQIFAQALNTAMGLIPHGGYQDLPIREAIDFVHMYLHLTIKGFKFRFGAPVCGGPIEIGFVTTDRCFRWARHKRFDTAIFEEEVGEL